MRRGHDVGYTMELLRIISSHQGLGLCISSWTPNCCMARLGNKRINRRLNRTTNQMIEADHMDTDKLMSSDKGAEGRCTELRERVKGCGSYLNMDLLQGNRH
jgi:hypothetical protein